MAYSLGKSPICDEIDFLKKPYLITVNHDVYLWDDSIQDGGVILVDILNQGEIMVVLSIHENTNKKYSSESFDCLIFSQKGKFGWALIDMNSIIYL